MENVALAKNFGHDKEQFNIRRSKTVFTLFNKTRRQKDKEEVANTWLIKQLIHLLSFSEDER